MIVLFRRQSLCCAELEFWGEIFGWFKYVYWFRLCGFDEYSIQNCSARNQVPNEKIGAYRLIGQIRYRDANAAFKLGIGSQNLELKNTPNKYR